MVQTGIGKKRIEKVMSAVLEQYPVDCLISTGFGGALTRKLSAGDIVLTNAINGSNGHHPSQGYEPFHPDASLLQHAAASLDKSNLRWVWGTGITVISPAATTRDKESLAENYLADVCDMEDYWLARLAAEKTISFLAVRVISDDIQTNLPDYDRIFDEKGDLKILMSAAYLLIHPGYLLQTLSLWSAARRAGDNLAVFLKNFLDA